MHTLDKLCGFPSPVEKFEEVRDDLRAQAGDVVLVGDDEDVHTEDQVFVGRVAFRDLLGVRQVIDVADHSVNSFGIIVVTEVDIFASGDLSRLSVLCWRDQVWETYWKQAGKSFAEVSRLVREDSLVCEDMLAVEFDSDVGQITVAV